MLTDSIASRYPLKGWKSWSSESVSTTQHELNSSVYFFVPPKMLRIVSPLMARPRPSKTPSGRPTPYPLLQSNSEEGPAEGEGPRPVFSGARNSLFLFLCVLIHYTFLYIFRIRRVRVTAIPCMEDKTTRQQSRFSSLSVRSVRFAVFGKFFSFRGFHFIRKKSRDREFGRAEFDWLNKTFVESNLKVVKVF